MTSPEGLSPLLRRVDWHAAREGLETHVGDLEELLWTAWNIMEVAQRQKFMRSQTVKDLLEVTEDFQDESAG